ncbi:MAG: hypothetical protein Q7S34_02735 [bacterium]|nr:hypothetical protein [bacterium]
MPPSYEKNLLEKLVAQAEENNKILKGLRRTSRWATFFGFLKWVIILAPIIWAYIYFQPYLGSFGDLLKKFPEQIRALENVSNQIQGAKDFLQNPPKISL